MTVIRPRCSSAISAIQLLRFAKPPTISVSDPATAVSRRRRDRDRVHVPGHDDRRTARSRSATGRRDPLQATADSDRRRGARTCRLRRGRNHFKISARSTPTPASTRNDRSRYIINVPFPTVQAPTLTVDQPAEGATYENGAIPVQGKTTNADTVVVSATYTRRRSTGPRRSPASRAAAAQAPTTRRRVTLPVGEDGAFSAPVRADNRAAGRSPSPRPTRRARRRAHPERHDRLPGRHVVVTIQGGRAWLKVWVDGKLVPTIGRRRARSSATARSSRSPGKQSIEVRTGASGATYFTVNGVDSGKLGNVGNPETWLFAPPARSPSRPTSSADEATSTPRDRRPRPASSRWPSGSRRAASRPADGRHRRVVHRRARRPR